MGASSTTKTRRASTTLPRVLLLGDMTVCAALFFATGYQHEATFLPADASDMVHDWDVSLLDLLILAALRVLVQFWAWTRVTRLAKKAVDDPRTVPAAHRSLGRLRLLLGIVPSFGMAYGVAKLVYFETGHAEHLRRGTSAAWILAQALPIFTVAACVIEAVLGLNARTRFLHMCGLRVSALSLNGHSDSNNNNAAAAAITAATEGGHKGFSAAGDSSEDPLLQADGTRTGKANFRRLARLAYPERYLILGGLVALVGSSGTTIAAPLFFGRVIDASTHPQGAAQAMALQVFILGGIYLAGAVAGFCRTWLFTWAGQRLVTRIRSTVLRAIVAQELAFFDVTRTGELTNRLASDTQVIQNALTVNISMLVRYLVQIIGSLAVMFGLSWRLTLVLLSVVPPVAIGAVWYGKKVKALRKRYQDELAAASAVAEETFSNMRTVKSFANEMHAQNLYV